FDLGAESGRAMLGGLRSGVLELKEVHRFPNEPVGYLDSLHWDVPRLWLEMGRAFDALAGTTLSSIGIDTWGCDCALVGERGNLLALCSPYRARRAGGVMSAVFRLVPRERTYAITGTQFLPFNTLYQLYAACETTPRMIEAARTIGTIADLLNYWLTGTFVSEFTRAPTTQWLEPR